LKRCWGLISFDNFVCEDRSRSESEESDEGERSGHVEKRSVLSKVEGGEGGRRKGGVKRKNRFERRGGRGWRLWKLVERI